MCTKCVGEKLEARIEELDSVPAVRAEAIDPAANIGIAVESWKSPASQTKAV